MKVLVTGGAGYIGSHMALELIDKNIEVIVLDNLASGFKKLIPPKAVFIKGDIGDLDLLNKIFNTHNFDAIAHFAADIKVEESIENPYKYYKNNTEKTLNFVNFLSLKKNQNLIFSSTAAVYDHLNNKLINEDDKLSPLNPYGYSKMMCEQIIKDIAKISTLNYFILRYFNVAGADPSLRSGQLTSKATHLIKVCVECALKKRPFLEIYGNDYLTTDGTCVRDYIHVSDLISGHLIALKHLINGGKSDICNLGYGYGYSVLEIVEKVKKVSGYNFTVKVKNKRRGDPSYLVSNPKKIKEIYGWNPSHNNIEKIIGSALDWEEKNNLIV